RHPRTYALLQSSIHKATRHWQNFEVLDAGCGSGDTGRFLTDKNRVTGLDFSHQMLKYAVYSRVLMADVEQLPFKRASFDGVLAVGVWQCLTPETPFLQEVTRVLRPNGEAVFGWILNRDYLLYRKGVTFRLDPEVTLSLLTRQHISLLLKQAGLQVIEFYAVLFPLGVWQLRGLSPLVPAYTVRCKRIEQK
ncbi:MAG: methyltransferase domain-containing protein, partial [Anaerolineae bacterium]|nr:methyltransferase domain-containing protein [Anaerolineae bacterium]